MKIVDYMINESTPFNIRLIDKLEFEEFQEKGHVLPDFLKGG